MKSDDGVTAVVGAADSHMGAYYVQTTPYSNPIASGIRLRHRSNLQSNDWSFRKLTEIGPIRRNAAVFRSSN